MSKIGCIIRLVN